ncbi:uncharacterized protein HMPREF1120_06438 [Exophiala dermatitidis NIH/UT8656]|uniref:Uncharacterized protein n=1 Tax=Exophiala dermatitidis (strain ATCC 34100 / CBS 525.76 / NIH/UT8656) TaxID=858893 RepID=H6C492_EXODN|nr:uncharacterized protein HMPREF1120_06438 [Exophiala dermatitidis NIH/UT8656]EHY58428.1 hypothetical protein HMPREF1120_06438 [Exophiala dermatitidis NIH/UT8656]
MVGYSPCCSVPALPGMSCFNISYYERQHLSTTFWKAIAVVSSRQDEIYAILFCSSLANRPCFKIPSHTTTIFVIALARRCGGYDRKTPVPRARPTNGCTCCYCTHAQSSSPSAVCTLVCIVHRAMGLLYLRSTWMPPALTLEKRILSGLHTQFVCTWVCMGCVHHSLPEPFLSPCHCFVTCIGMHLQTICGDPTSVLGWVCRIHIK